jgi:hypothetical protein
MLFFRKVVLAKLHEIVKEWIKQQSIERVGVLWSFLMARNDVIYSTNSLTMIDTLFHVEYSWKFDRPSRRENLHVWFIDTGCLLTR